VDNEEMMSTEVSDVSDLSDVTDVSFSKICVAYI
jgi:hypothetical protein